MSWGSTGWEDTEPTDKGTLDRRKDAVRRLYIPADVVKRVLFLEDMPFKFWEHDLYEYTKSGKDKAVCLEKNKIEELGCPVCDDDKWPKFVGMFSIMDLGDVVYNDGKALVSGFLSKKGDLWQFQRKGLVARRGTKERPGMLPAFLKMKQRRGGLKGCVFDCSRRTNQSEVCGDVIEFLTKVPEDRWAEYIRALGSDDERIPKDSISFVPFKWAEELQVHTHEQLRKLVGNPSVNATPEGGSVQGAGYGGSEEESSQSSQSSQGGQNDGTENSPFPPGPPSYEDDIPF